MRSRMLILVLAMAEPWLSFAGAVFAFTETDLASLGSWLDALGGMTAGNLLVGVLLMTMLPKPETPRTLRRLFLTIAAVALSLLWLSHIAYFASAMRGGASTDAISLGVVPLVLALAVYPAHDLGEWIILKKSAPPSGGSGEDE